MNQLPIINYKGMPIALHLRERKVEWIALKRGSGFERFEIRNEVHHGDRLYN